MTRQRGRPFQPGQSGNPKGRPKGRGLKAAIRQALEETTVDGEPPPAEKIADLIVRKALRSPEFALKVADYIDPRTNRVQAEVEARPLSAPRDLFVPSEEDQAALEAMLGAGGTFQ